MRAFRSASVFALAVLAAASAGARSVSLDLRPRAPAAEAGSRGVAPGAAPAAAAEDGALRRTALAAGAANAPALAPGDELSLRLFDDADVALVLRERIESPLGGETFLAGPADGPLAAVVLQTEAGLSVEALDAASGRSFSVVAAPDGVAVRERAPAETADTVCREVVPDLPAAAAREADLRAAGDQPEATLDVLVAFDADAAAWARAYGGGTTNFATVCVAKMNVALANSGLGAAFRFRIVGTVELAASAAGEHPDSQSLMFDATLSAVQSGSGAWAEAKAARDRVGADLVTTLIDTGSAHGTTGLGYGLRTTDFASFSEHPFNVCAVRAVAAGHTMTHECGHNLGAGHATAVNADRISPGPQLYDYSAGHFFTGADGVAYHSIMAYNWDGFGAHYELAPLFSSPERTWAGTAAGDAAHDNARTIRQTWAAASTWRGRKVPASYDVFFSPADGTDFDGSLEVTLTPGKAGLPIRYTLDGTDPTLSSPLYAGPIVLAAAATIRAAAETDGVLGPVHRAYYGPDPIAIALEAPQMPWTNDAGNPWVVDAAVSHTGGSSVRSALLSTGATGAMRLETAVTGPTNLTFRYRRHFTSDSLFGVFVSPAGAPYEPACVFHDTDGGTAGEWRLVECAVPAGEQRVVFTYQQGSSYYVDYDGDYDFNGVWLDTVRVGTLSRSPTVLPETTGHELAARTFTGSLEVSIVPPAGVDGVLWYSTDGTDPLGDNGRVYAGPFAIAASTRVRAAFVEPGRDPSAEADALYLERHAVGPGEWTPDPGGAVAAAAADPGARLVAVLLMALTGPDPDCDAFAPLARDPAFLAWCADNGVYLVAADPSAYLESKRAEDWFWDLHDAWLGTPTGVAQVPGLHFVRPAATNVPVAQGVAMVDPAAAPPYSIGTVPYDGSLGSLVAGFASVLASNAAPVAVSAGSAEVPVAWLERRFPGAAAASNEWAALALLDADGDGFAAWQEFLAGSDPADAASRLRATVRVEGGEPVFGFAPTNAALLLFGHRYVPGGKTDLDERAWSPFRPGHRFYRIAIEPSAGLP